MTDYCNDKEEKTDVRHLYDVDAADLREIENDMLDLSGRMVRHQGEASKINDELRGIIRGIRILSPEIRQSKPNKVKIIEFSIIRRGGTGNSVLKAFWDAVGRLGINMSYRHPHETSDHDWDYIYQQHKRVSNLLDAISKCDDSGGEYEIVRKTVEMDKDYADKIERAKGRGNER